MTLPNNMTSNQTEINETGADFDLTQYRFNDTVLREYDVRGIVGETLSEKDAFYLGAAFGTLLWNKSGKKEVGSQWVCVGYDGRHTSIGFEAALVKGLTKVGINVDRIGRGPTPMVYFTAMDHMSDGAVMITGSHNPSEYNGFKMVLQGGAVYGDLIQELGRIAAEGAFHQTDKEGQTRSFDMQEAYINRLLKDYEAVRPLKVVWDAGNGATGDVLRELVKRLPGEHILLFDTIDGDFPNHHPDPTVDKNLEDLRRVVLEQGCDLGVAFDGDGDRIGAVDEKGEVIRCDTLLALYAREVLSDYPGATIVGDVKCSQTMYEEILRLGGAPLMWKTGHSLIKAKMKELKAPLGGELSGHIFFADKYYGFDDALYCALRLMNEIENSDGPLSSLTAHIPQQYNTPEMRLEVDESVKFKTVEAIADAAKAFAAEQDNVTVADIDGVRIQSEDGWWLIRASNTQNCIVARIEATSPKALEKLTVQLDGFLGPHGLSLQQDINRG